MVKRKKGFARVWRGGLEKKQIPNWEICDKIGRYSNLMSIEYRLDVVGKYRVNTYEC